MLWCSPFGASLSRSDYSDQHGQAIILECQSASPQGKEKDFKRILLVAQLARDLELGIGRMLCECLNPTVTFGMRRAYRFPFCPCPIQLFFLFASQRRIGAVKGRLLLLFLLLFLVHIQQTETQYMPAVPVKLRPMSSSCACFSYLFLLARNLIVQEE